MITKFCISASWSHESDNCPTKRPKLENDQETKRIKNNVRGRFKMGIPASQQIKRIKIPLTNPLIAPPIMNDKDNSRLESGVIKSSGSV